MQSRADVVIVGGGFAGSSLAALLARGGLHTVVLERTTVHHDRVRGEFMAPWGVAEARTLALLDPLLAAGANFTTVHIPFSEGIDPDVARRRAMDMGQFVPGVAGPLCMQHVAMANVLNEVAVQSGADLIRGVERVQITTDNQPKVRFTFDGGVHEVHCRMIVGADGRGSTVAKQVGIELARDAPHHFLGGMLVDGVEQWPTNVQTIGTEGDLMFFVFPQGKGRVRLYACYPREDSHRFSGPGGPARFLNSFRLQSVPESECLAAALPAGPYHGYPNEDMWADRPVRDGVVLIGDAAGHNDPTTGQGLAISLRDVRLVSDILLSGRDWSSSAFEPYVEERRERMRRLRLVARLISKLRAEFGEDAKARRLRALDRMATDPSVGLPFAANLKGPDALPASAFEKPAFDRLLS